MLGKDRMNNGTLWMRVKKKVEQKSEREIKVPVGIFKQKISPAEALCKYLREKKEMKFSEIARLINRDERTVWTNYNHAIEKMVEKIEIEYFENKFISVDRFVNRKLSVLESVVKSLKDSEYKNYEIA